MVFIVSSTKLDPLDDSKKSKCPMTKCPMTKCPLTQSLFAKGSDEASLNSKPFKPDSDRFEDIDLERGDEFEATDTKVQNDGDSSKNDSLARIVEYIFIAILVAEIVSALALVSLFLAISRDMAQDEPMRATVMMNIKPTQISIANLEEASKALNAIAIRLYIRESLSNLLAVVIPSCLIMITAWILTMVEARVNHRSINIMLIMFGTVGYALVSVIAVKLIQLSFSIY